jgi:hypothetical protein
MRERKKRPFLPKFLRKPTLEELREEIRETEAHIEALRSSTPSVTVHLTENGKKKVGHDSIPTTEDLQYRGDYIVVTSLLSGRTYILHPNDIDYIS